MSDPSTSSVLQLGQSERPRIYIKGLSRSRAFNGSTVWIGNHRLLAYRTGNGARSIGFAWLDGSLSPLIDSVLETDLVNNEDPRLLMTTRGDLYLSTTYCARRPLTPGRIELRQIGYDGEGNLWEKAVLGKFEHVANWPGYVRRLEKNWAPFEASGALWYVYSICPHRVLRIEAERGGVWLVHETPFKRPAWWDASWGKDLRLSAPPARLSNGTFLGTWHSKARGDYWTGFYEFEGTPPFRVLRFAGNPSLTPHDATGRNTRNPGAVRCIFICGMEVDERRDEILLTGGDNDHSVVVFRLSLAETRQRMREVRL